MPGEETKMRRTLRTIGLVLLCFVMTACGKKSTGKTEPEAEQGNDVNYHSMDYRSQFLTEDYALYMSNIGFGRLQLFDVKSRQNMVFCFDPGCEHKRAVASADGTAKESCIAYTFSGAVMLRNGRLYFLSDSGDVMCADEKGENRRKIGSIPSYIRAGYRVFFTDDYLYVIWENPYEMVETTDGSGQTQWIVGAPKETQDCGIWQVNLKDGTGREVFRKETYNAYVYSYDMRQGHLYFSYLYQEIKEPENLSYEENIEFWKDKEDRKLMEVYDYDTNSGELRLILNRKTWGEICFCKESFAMEDADGGVGLYRYNGERFQRYDFPTPNMVWTESGFVCGSYNKETGNTDYRLIDEKSGEIVRSVSFPWDSFIAQAILKESCYGMLKSDLGTDCGYVPTEDFWKGDFSNAVPFLVN